MEKTLNVPIVIAGTYQRLSKYWYVPEVLQVPVPSRDSPILVSPRGSPSTGKYQRFSKYQYLTG